MWEVVFKWITNAKDVAFLRELRSGIVDAYSGNFQYFNGEYVHLSGWRTDWLLKQIDEKILYLESPRYHIDGVLRELKLSPELFREFVDLVKELL